MLSSGCGQDLVPGSCNAQPVTKPFRPRILGQIGKTAHPTVFALGTLVNLCQKPTVPFDDCEYHQRQFVSCLCFGKRFQDGRNLAFPGGCALPFPRDPAMEAQPAFLKAGFTIPFATILLWNRRRRRWLSRI